MNCNNASIPIMVEFEDSGRQFQHHHGCVPDKLPMLGMQMSQKFHALECARNVAKMDTDSHRLTHVIFGCKHGSPNTSHSLGLPWAPITGP